MREIPGVDAASFVDAHAARVRRQEQFVVSVDGYTPAPNEEMIVYYNRVGCEHLRTLGIRLVEGREFTERDTPDTTDVAVINETMARRYFGGRDPDRRPHPRRTRTVEVVGVARRRQVHAASPKRRAPFMYVPAPAVVSAGHRPGDDQDARRAGGIVPRCRRRCARLDANIPLFDVRTIAEHLEIGVFVQRMIASMLGAFGILALLLATVGLYGVIAAIAAQRTPEIGMRMALGRERGDIVALILRQAFGMIGAGIAIGLAVAFGVTRLFKSLLVGVSTTDRRELRGTTALLLVVGLVGDLSSRPAGGVDQPADGAAQRMKAHICTRSW